MVSTLFFAGISIALFYCYSQYRSLRYNIEEAKKSGLPYRVAPVYFQQFWWLVTQDLLSPLLRQLPKKWTESWLPFSIFGRVWHEGYTPFASLGSDTFIMVSPAGNILWTCDPEAILQISSRRLDFLKPVKMMGMLNMYGPTITATEGEESRLYRKITAPSFSEETHRLVWIESLQQTEAMLKSWSKREESVILLNKDMASLTLHVISRVCFARKIEWMGDQHLQDEVPQGHTLSYREAIGSVLDNFGTLFLTPPLLLNNSPLKIHRKAKESFLEWRKYMEEMRDETQEKLTKTEPELEKNLLETLVQAGHTSSTDTKEPLISPAAVLGNIHIFIVGGHETTANTLTYAIILLACRPAFQRALQVDLDKIFDNRPRSEWSYKTDFAKLLDGYAGAIMNETIRLYSVLPFLPKTTEAIPQSLTLGSRNYMVPANTLCMINTSAAHRHPKYWPKTISTAADGPPYPVSSFDPAYWLKGKASNGSENTPFNPVPGSYIPFAEGPRACIGKRFAQVEFCAVIAALFKGYSVELAVEGDGQDLTSAESRGLWERARQDAERELSTGVGFLLSLKMSGKVPLRLVKRGEEKWTF